MKWQSALKLFLTHEQWDTNGGILDVNITVGSIKLLWVYQWFFLMCRISFIDQSPQKKKKQKKT
jgi:hypothetical protein